jgi:hypothetical protein
MTVWEAIAFLQVRGWQVFKRSDDRYDIQKPKGISLMERDDEGLCRLAEAVQKAEAEARK